MTKRFRVMSGCGMVALLAAGLAVVSGPVKAAEDDITGVVTSASGPEAGVWVIAETPDLDTTFRKIVVTDDAGRFNVPGLPAASYEVWVRGYGLVDSTKTQARPGDEVDLTATTAPTPEDAARIYPANYWYSLLEVPPPGDFPGTGARGNGIGTTMRTQADWVDRLKDGCQLCHQLGNQATREMPMLDLGDFDSTEAAWNYRLRAGGAASAMAVEINRMGRPRAVKLYAEWTDRIRAGALPPVPPRPQGKERNVVLTMWAWGHEQGMVHDEVATDKRDPTVNANGPIYGVGGAGLVVTDPQTHQSVRFDLPTRIPRQPRPSAGTPREGSGSGPLPSFYFGNERPGLVSQSAHNPMMDGKGRVWITQAVRPNDVPNWCLEGSDHPSARYYPIQHRAESRQVSFYEPDTEKFVLIDTCYFTHHLQFADDENDTLWLSGSTEAIGWLNTKLYDETGDERTSQGWCPTVIDTNGDGKITKPWNEPDDAIDPAKDTRIGGLDKFKRAYGVMPHPDGSVWITRRFDVPGRLIRLDLGDNPPETCKSEVYEPPYDPNGDPSKWGYGPRGIDVDRATGVLWTALGGSGHLASFDRSKCSVLNGPTATGQHCTAGWTLYPSPGPALQGVEGSAVNADYHYYNWVDQFDTLGLGENVPIATGTTSDALLALMPDTGEWVIMRVPYPLGFYSRGLDGRIDDPSTGWKGRGVWSSFNTGSTFHLEGGKGMTSQLVRFQIRPDPLAN
jgi:hypothetical protein